MQKVSLHTVDCVTSWINDATFAYVPSLFSWSEQNPSYAKGQGIGEFYQRRSKRHLEDAIKI